MDITIKLSHQEVSQIVENHILKKVPVHTAGKVVYTAGDGYSGWTVRIEEKNEDA